MSAQIQSPTPMTTPALLANYSLEMTAKDIPELEKNAANIPQGTRISVTFLPGESEDARLEAAVAVRRLGFVPIPHLSARRFTSALELERYLGRLAEHAASDYAFVIAGDLPQAAGPFDDALAIIQSGLLEKHGVRHVGISGYPEGHPDISNDKLWAAMRDKHAALRERGMEVSLITQFGFDAEPILSWVEQVRGNGIDATIYAGAPGPASVKVLLKFASRCGVQASARVMSKYGLSLTRLLSTAGPDSLVAEMAAGMTPAHGNVRVHFYPFGGFTNTLAWIAGANRG